MTRRGPVIDGSGPSEPELSGTARVILGMIALGRDTGYDIKQLVDASTRHFWAASYGQIYPELRRLEQLGLVRGEERPAGGRARTVYELTGAGRESLRGWLQGSAEPLYELRDEGLLKLFFADSLPASTVLEQLETIRARHERQLAELREIETVARSAPMDGPYLTLQFGIGLSEWAIQWCRETAERVRAGGELQASRTVNG